MQRNYKIYVAANERIDAWNGQANALQKKLIRKNYRQKKFY